jgi:formylglycine-generating enzyme required for sulfatase activity/energy-coupling factor transporter ATP-binding protein EcfA2
MLFSLDTWRAEVRARIADLARDPRGALQRAGVDTIYGFLLGSTLLPVAAAAAHDPGSAIVALTGIVGSVGANLVSNLVQKRYDGPDAAAVIAAEATDPALAPAYAKLVAELDVLALAKAELAGHTELLQRLDDELRRLGPSGLFAGATIRIEQSGGVNLGVGATIARSGDLVGGNKIVNNFFGGHPGEDGQRLLRDYLSALLDECRQLRLARLTGRAQTGAEQSAVPQVRLDQVYTDLTVDDQVQIGRSHIYAAPRGRAVVERYLRRVDPDVAPAARSRFVTVTTAESKDARRNIAIGDDFRALPDDAQVEVTAWRLRLALEAAQSRRLVLLGEPGAGKSTVLRELALLLALRLTGQSVAIPGWPADAAPVPVYVPLGRVAALFERHQHDAHAALRQAIGDALEGEQHVRAGLRNFLTPALRSGGVILLLDGLDELPAAVRTQVALALRQLAQDVAAPLVVTSRVLPYRESADWQLPADEGWQVQTIQPLAFGQVRVFVRQWYAALADPRSDLTPERAAERADELIAQLQQRPELVPLIRSPLLLTMLAILHYNTADVPRDRVRLYEECVQLLLERWEPERTSPWVSHPRLAERLGNIPGLTIEHIRNVLHKLAFESHDAPPGDDGRGVIDGERLSGKMVKLFRRLGARDPAAAEEAFVRVLRADAGLLQERGEGVFVFPHLTFQEYLAACYLADLPGMGEEATQRWCSADAERWREALMLLVGRLRRQGKTDNTLIPWLARLAAARVGRDAKEPARRRREALLAALCYAELGSAAALATSTVDIEAQLEQPLRAAIVDLLAVHDPAITVTDRIAAARVLGELGDPRTPVTMDEWQATLARRNEMFGKPDGYWCYVKPGTYRIGGWKRSEASANITLRPYWIARYPVTVAQYRAFIDADGYARDEYWTLHGRTWKQKRNRTRPLAWDELRYTGANQPVIGVTWYEAAAFCSWLNAHLRAALPEEYALRLPTEAEWEVAAAYDAAGQRRAYPWGSEDPTPERAIYDASRLNAAAPVGCCPAGAAACGALDMAGNVWEVTTSRFDQYPAGSARWEKDVPPDEGDVPWRGGSWWSGSTYVRCGARGRIGPIRVRYGSGFRLVVAPHSH